MLLPNIGDVLSKKIKPFIAQEYACSIYFIYTYYPENAFIIPEYQRGYVWDIEQQENLIRSLFYGITIPPLILNINGERGTWTVIDGQQRITTIIRFLSDKLKVDGYYFKDLTDVQKRFFTNKKLGYLETQFTTIEEEKAYYKLFNTAGTLHTNEELGI